MAAEVPVGGAEMHDTVDPGDPIGFDPEVLDSAVIALPLKKLLEKAPDEPHHVVIDINFNYHQGRDAARQKVASLIKTASSQTVRVDQDSQSDESHGTQYVYATLTAPQIKEIVKLDRESAPEGSTKHRAIFHIWPDFEIKAF